MTRTRSTTIAVALAALLGLAVGFASSASGASAAALAVDTAPQVSLTTAQRCAAAMNGADAVVQVAPSGATAVTVAAVPAACAGLALTINLHDAAGDIIATGATASAAMTQDVNVGAFSSTRVAAAVASIGGWIFPTSWAGQPPVTPGCVGVDASGNETGQACTLTFVQVEHWPQPHNPTMTKINFTAVTDAPLWKVTFDFSDTSLWYGFTPAVVLNVQNVALAPGYSCSSLPIFQGIEANPGWNSASGEIHISTDPSAGGNRLCG